MNQEVLSLFSSEQQSRVQTVLEYCRREISARGLNLSRLYPEELYRHCEQVAILSILLGILYDFDLHRLLNLGMGGYLHDIGKCEIAGFVLDKPGLLDQTECQLIQAHPSIGYRRLQPYAFDEEITDCVLWHHEKLDGGGYPTGRKDIPILVQLVTIADMFDAIYRKRVYHEDRTLEEVFHILDVSPGLNETAVDILKHSLCQ